MDWVKKYKLSTVKAIKYNNYLYLEIDDLWHALHSTFNIAQNQQFNTDVLDEIPSKSFTS